MKGGSSLSRFPREGLWAYAFIAPPLLGFVLFGLGPVLASLALSFTSYDVLTAPRFVGFLNYRRLFTDDFFVGKTLLNTAFYVGGVPIGIAIALFLALLLDDRRQGRSASGGAKSLPGLFRTIYFIPSVCSVVALALLWSWIYRPDYGLLDMLLAAVGVRPGSSPSWLADPHFVKPSLVVMGIWSSLGYDVVLFVAALKNVPRELLEAAELDGANAWQRFRHVTFPAISPTVFFVSVTGTIAALQSFDQVYVMTRGGPAYSSASYMLYVYLQGFQYFDMGYACAMAWLLGVLILVITYAQFRLARKWVVSE